MSQRPAAGRNDRPEWRQSLEEQIGEDPGRFLDYPLLSNDANTSPLLLARARIRGIDHINVVNAWIAAERRLDRGPRAKVLEWLEDRKEALEAHGERGDRADGERKPVPEKEWHWIRDGERIPYSELDRRGAVVST